MYPGALSFFPEELTQQMRGVKAPGAKMLPGFFDVSMSWYSREEAKTGFFRCKNNENNARKCMKF